MEVGVFKRSSIALGILVVLLSAGPLPAFARSITVAQKTTKSAASLLLTAGLLPCHRYRIDIIAPAHRTFGALAVENFMYVSNGRLSSATKTVTIRGTASKSVKLPTPSVQGQITGWNVEISVQLAAGKGLTARVVDTGGT